MNVTHTKSLKHQISQLCNTSQHVHTRKRKSIHSKRSQQCRKLTVLTARTQRSQKALLFNLPQSAILHMRWLPARCASAREGVCVCLHTGCVSVRWWGSIFPLKDSLYSLLVAGHNGAITSAMTQQMGFALPYLLHSLILVDQDKEEGENKWRVWASHFQNVLVNKVIQVNYGLVSVNKAKYNSSGFRQL